MPNLIEAANWEPGIYQLEVDDPVMGGENGIDNLQAKQLAARTNYLNAAIANEATARANADTAEIARANAAYLPLAGNAAQVVSVAPAVLAAQAVNLGQFVMSSVTAGQVFRIPQLLGASGKNLIMQAGGTPAVAGGGFSPVILFPVSFPTACIAVLPVWVGGSSGSIEVVAVTASSFQVGNGTIGSAANQSVYLAIGY